MVLDGNGIDLRQRGSTLMQVLKVFSFLSLFAIAACDDIALPSLGGGQTPLTQAAMSGGSVKLATPQGYCIDPRSLRRDFALLGRCDTLGAEGFFAAWELAVITVSLAPVTPESASPDASTLISAPGGAEVLRTIERGGLTFVQLRGSGQPFEGVSDTHWRTALVLNGQLMSLALYAPDDSGASGAEGASILLDVARASRAATQG